MIHDQEEGTMWVLLSCMCRNEGYSVETNWHRLYASEQLDARHQKSSLPERYKCSYLGRPLNSCTRRSLVSQTVRGNWCLRSDELHCQRYCDRLIWDSIPGAGKPFVVFFLWPRSLIPRTGALLQLCDARWWFSTIGEKGRSWSWKRTRI